MPKEHKIRYGWLKAMYIYTIVGAGGFGLGIIVMPTLMRTIFNWPAQDPIVYGVMGSVYLSFALLSILGLKSPLKFVPVLLLQLSYKVVWFIGVVAPILFTGRFQPYAILHVAIFLSYIVGDLIAIPFPYVFGKETDPAPEHVTT
jgi:hypothetical protein